MRTGVFCIVFCLLPLAGQTQTRAELEAELARQRDLLGQLRDPERAADPVDRRSAPSSSIGDGRSAPAVPRERELPVEIFDERKVVIKKGRWGNPKKLRLIERVLDGDQDGKPELVRWYTRDSEQIVRQMADRDLNGRIDSWNEYEKGELVRRSLDADDDGTRDTWESYAQGRMTSREIDRNGDGTRDALFEYRNNQLALESYDANDDGRVDLRIEYQNMRRVRSQEDHDKDGRMDIWTRYVAQGDRDLPVEIERDRLGRGKPNTFERFEAAPGSAESGVQLVERAEDVDGDGSIDVISSYERGKIVRREIADPKRLGERTSVDS